ncbi:hypothetical protein EAE32_01315 [Kocuria tytonicola]|uniref:Serine/threonine protein kinase n=1 Tax=Kocuria tytonicola TaxID=2055946 RepID=A0A3L9L4H6_9MICC|nr:hypothetical protein [Kocuria tytonicola]RLY93916.1 hypothetical protein EAE32_01315 [Kocuria tytonicola]
MSQPIALGAILGGRYKVSASLLSTAEDDHVLQGEDQILRRRISILVPAAAHESTVVHNARALAAGAGHSGFQVLDMGQTEDTTYLVTSYTPASDLLDALLFTDEDSDDYSLSDDIFGNPRTASSSSYIYQEPDPTQSQQRVSRHGEDSEPDVPAVTRWDGPDDDSYDDAPAAPSVRNRLGMARKVRPAAVRSTLFDRAASRGGSAGATVAAGAIDPTYDGDNRYESFERTEGKPDRLDDRTSSSRTAPREDLHRGDLPEADLDHEDTAPVDLQPAPSGGAGHGAADPAASAPATGGGPDAAVAEQSTGAAAGAAEEPTGPTPESEPEEGGSGGATAAAEGENRRGPLRWLLLMLLALVLIGAIVLGFRGLGSLTSHFAQQGPPQQSAATGPQEGTPAASVSPSATAAPAIGSVTRVTSDPEFMADTDATLNQATDGNPATYWLSYGFSNATFGSLADSVGLAAQLKEPATAQELTVQQANGTGGRFTVYVSDQPGLEGAQEVGKGSFTGPEIRVPLSDAARSTPHRFVLVVWTELPQLTSPIGGYPYGLRIGEISLR